MALIDIYRNQRWIRKIFSMILYMKWKVTAKHGDITPHIVKQRLIKYFRKRFDIKILVETGTYLGDMVNAQRKHFNKIYSIELNNDLYNRANKLFSKYTHIELFCGDSSESIEKVIKLLKEPALFWLDAHYSGGITSKSESQSAVIGELNHIFNSNYQHVILIDDARCFNGKGGYPSIEQIEKIIKNKSKNYQISIEYDIIFLIPFFNS